MKESERLTQWMIGRFGFSADLKTAFNYQSPEAELKDLPTRYKKALRRLAEYEDTGLLPTEIMLLLGERRRNNRIEPEQLRELERFDWVWIEILDPEAFGRYNFKHDSGYYRVFQPLIETRETELWCGYPGMAFIFDYCDYGRTWEAYRRKP